MGADRRNKDSSAWPKHPNATLAVIWGERVNALSDKAHCNEVLKRFPMSEKLAFNDYVEAIENFINCEREYSDIALKPLATLTLEPSAREAVTAAEEECLCAYGQLLDAAIDLLQHGCPRRGMFADPINWLEWLSLLELIEEQLGKDIEKRKRNRLRAKDAPLFSLFFPLTADDVVNALPESLRIVIRRKDFSRHSGFRLLKRLIEDKERHGVKCDRDRRNNLCELLKKKASEMRDSDWQRYAYRETAQALRSKRGFVRLTIPRGRIEILD